MTRIILAARPKRASALCRYRCPCGNPHFGIPDDVQSFIRTTCGQHIVKLIVVNTPRRSLPHRTIASRRYWFHRAGGWIETEDGRLIHPNKWEVLHPRLREIAGLA